MSKTGTHNQGRGRRRLLRGASSLAVFAAFCAPALASDGETKAEIRALKEQLRKLERRLEAQEKAPKVVRVKEVETGPISKDVGVGAIWPGVFHYKAVTITPGGFFEFTGLHRDHFIGADIATPFSAIPYANSPTAHQDETRFGARRSRFILQTDADLDAITHARMYLATDFLSDAQTGTFTQSDSWNLRWRELYLKLDRSDFGSDFATHFAVGQMYTLISMNSRGTTPDTFLTPPVIDDQYMPGYTWSRQVGLRISQNFTKDFQVAFGAEQSYTTFGTPGIAANGSTAIVPSNVACLAFPGVSVAPATTGAYPGCYQQTPVSGSLYNNLNNISFADVPDLMAKAAWDPDVMGHSVHIEGGGVLRNFSDRTFGGNHDVWGGGGFAGVIVQVIPKLLDFQVSGITGRGISRYGAADQTIPDVAFNWAGGLTPIHERQAMVGVTAHLTPQTDVYVFAGGEFAAPTWSDAGFPKGLPYVTTGFYAFGYGNPAFVNTGCNFEGANTATYGTVGGCVGQTKDVRQVTTGIWHNFYDGPAGKLRVGAQYAYTVRDSFQGVGGAYKGNENMIFTSIRYYPFN